MLRVSDIISTSIRTERLNSRCEKKQEVIKENHKYCHRRNVAHGTCAGRYSC